MRAALVTAAALAASTAVAQAPTRLDVTALAPGFHLVSSPDGNLLLFTGDSVSVVIGVHAPLLVRRVRELHRQLEAPPVRYALALEAENALGFGDGGWTRDRVETLAHERLLGRILERARDTTRAAPAAPRFGFSRVVQLYAGGEEIHIVHDHKGATDAEVIVHFERAGLLMLGGMFPGDGYPKLLADRGADLDGMIKWIDWFCSVFQRGPSHVEPIVPLRGRPATLAELTQYRDMLTTVRQRVKTLVDSGRTADQVVATRPTADFDARWGSGAVSPEAFVRSVHRLVQRP